MFFEPRPEKPKTRFVARLLERFDSSRSIYYSGDGRVLELTSRASHRVIEMLSLIINMYSRELKGSRRWVAGTVKVDFEHFHWLFWVIRRDLQTVLPFIVIKMQQHQSGLGPPGEEYVFVINEHKFSAKKHSTAGNSNLITMTRRHLILTASVGIDS